MSDDYFLAMVAKMHYVDKVKQREIAQRFNITAMAVSRALREAEGKGIVTIHVKTPWQMELNLGRLVREKYGLRECFVMDIPASVEVADVLGSFLADYFIQILPDHAVVGLSWGYTISRFVASLPYVRTHNCSLIQLTGAFSGNRPEVTPTQIINEVSKKLDSRIYILNAPLYASSIEMRDQLALDPTNVLIHEMAEHSDINIVGLSSLRRDATTFRTSVTGIGDYEELERLGAAGDLAGTFLDASGNLLRWSKSEMYTGVSLDTISKGKNTICVAGELSKVPLLRVTAGKGYFNTLITTRLTAEELIK